VTSSLSGQGFKMQTPRAIAVASGAGSEDASVR
jgi:hypothetical protein